MNTENAREHLIVALDVSSAREAVELVHLLKHHVGFFKVGLQLFSSSGPAIVERILCQGGKVFLDLKLHDIPNTVAHAVSEAMTLGVHMLTLHTLGGEAMLKRARQVVVEAECSKPQAVPKLLGVTVLTSMDQRQIESVGFHCPLEQLVLRLAHLADDSGLDGIVCSPQELNRLKKEGFRSLFFVTPGIRPRGSETDDQSRVQTAGEAIGQGASYLVVGRPITKAPDPILAAEALLAEIRHAKI